MTLTITSETLENHIEKITLEGQLTAANAPDFQKAIEHAAAQSPRALVLMLANLEYLASAGLRIILFAKQKLGHEVKIYAIAPRPDIHEVIKLSGFIHALTILEAYDAATIEG